MKWTDDEIDRLKALMAQNLPRQEMADRMGRSHASVVCKMAEIRQITAYSKPAAKTKQRDCITCKAPFVSTGPHHRMCVDCRANYSEQPFDTAFPVNRPGRGPE